jgi:transposase InsO family protein
MTAYSDQGSQHNSLAYQERLLSHHCQVSINQAVNCCDNAVMESICATLNEECASRLFTT